MMMGCASLHPSYVCFFMMLGYAVKCVGWVKRSATHQLSFFTVAVAEPSLGKAKLSDIANRRNHGAI